LKEKLFSVVILDINLHGRNGAEVLRFLMDHPDNHNHQTPFIISSGAINAKFIEKNDKKFAGILTKPFDHEELFHLVNGIINPEELFADELEELDEVDEDLDELQEALVETPSGNSEEIPYLKCSLPFTIPELEVMVNKVLDQIKKTPQLKNLFSKLKVDRNADNYSQTRIGLLINIAVGIAEKLDWGSEKTLEKFVYAAYLHDMALTGRPDLAKILNFDKLESLKSTLSESDYKLVWNHPEIGASTLENHKEIPADVVAMVRQHHELPAGRGFPAKITYHKITPLSTVFIVAHDFTDYIMNDPNWKLETYLQKFKGKFKGVHFLKVMAVLKEM
jgi:response regulator RpfG family c-di-GMP phosphodiesterase